MISPSVKLLTRCIRLALFLLFLVNNGIAPSCITNIIDASNGSYGAQGPPIKTGTPITTEGGLMLIYTDSNNNNILDTEDIWIIINGGQGDEIQLIHENGKTIETYTI